MIYTVTLNPAIDYVVQLPSPLQVGSINRTATEDIQFGGKGINVSVILQNFGITTTALGFIAGFTGKALEEGLQNMGITTRFLPVKDGMTRINVKIKDTEETEINGIGPVIAEADMQALYSLLDLLKKGDTLVLSGSIPKCLPADTYEKILSRLAGEDVRTVVDATGQLLVNTLSFRPFLIKPNDRELADIFGMYPETEQQIADYARQLQAMGARNVLVSLAEKGALLLDETGRLHRSACPQGTVVNSVGAGDSMVAGFLAGYQQTGDYAKALQLGIAAGSATAFSLGLASRAQIEALLHISETLQNA